jgi:DNA-directed RNA polymerase subunit RPC12/RpoP
MSDQALQQHRQDSPQHRRRNIYKPYHCAPCNRSFGDQLALNQHYRSSAHSPQSFKCPFCTSYFISPSAVVHHLESGCHGNTRHQVTHAVKRLSVVPSICIARRIEGASRTPPTTAKYYIASPRSFNGRAYACFICKRTFRSLYSLSDHLNSAAHDADEFKCPKCKKRFKLVSSLIQHLESAACRLAGLSQIQAHFQSLTARFSRLISL